MKQRDALGRFTRIHEEWTLDNFNDGYVANLKGKKRFKVYKSKHHRSNYMGYVLRSIVAYEAYNGVQVPRNMEVHHKDGNTLNDNRENLVLLTNSEHQKIHAIKKGFLIEHTCEHCGRLFYIQRFRLKDLSGGTKKRGRFCGQKCYHNHKRSDEHKKNISNGLKRAYGEGKRS
jgi:hypothetical protein